MRILDLDYHCPINEDDSDIKGGKWFTNVSSATAVAVSAGNFGSKAVVKTAIGSIIVKFRY